MISRALDRAHELRQFEIDSYWKRSQYFWLFQASAITLTGLIYSRAEGQALLLLAAGVGAVTAQVGWLTARGSKFWQSNWEAHVDRLEAEVEGRLTQVVLYQDGSVRSSLSRINERLFGLLFTVWLMFFALVAASMIWGKALTLSDPVIAIVGLGALLAALGSIVFRTRSSLNPSTRANDTLWDRFCMPRSGGPILTFDRNGPPEDERGTSDGADALP